MTVKTNPFNRGGVVKSELGSEEERADKILEMNQRGFVAVATYEYETTYLDRVATGYKKHTKISRTNQGIGLSY
ncbi:hypothetical protein [Planomicrobium okeanokoites]|uniref:Uncharacterized protein n=1 Tax=Planomicrobium okeanokoites TaxID=244 RepID=A0ABV7KT70_PLAOK|nr:hypothetical protein [Planomicrobium okeanokoites]TAA67455.1 hypothetical protein D2910_13775 [Planomicrobium okeanokoites]